MIIMNIFVCIEIFYLLIVFVKCKKMKRERKMVLFFFCSVLLLIGCGNRSDKDNNETDNINDSVTIVSEEFFRNFVDRFHNDSLFAMSRLNDSIGGINTDSHTYDSIMDDFVMDTLWCKDSIPLYYPFLRDFRLSKNVVIEYDSVHVPAQEYIYIPESSCYVKLRFVKKDGKWFLCGFDFAFL